MPEEVIITDPGIVMEYGGKRFKYLSGSGTSTIYFKSVDYWSEAEFNALIDYHAEIYRQWLESKR